MDVFKHPIKFQWDNGNRNKNFDKHGVTTVECEEAFFDPHKRVVKAAFLAGNEERRILVGATKDERILYVVFTVRSQKIRVISARDLNRKEKHWYEKAAKDPQV